MALKHLVLAAELLRGGMAVGDIANIIKMQDNPAEASQDASTKAAAEIPSEVNTEAPTEPPVAAPSEVPKPEEPKQPEPLNRPEANHQDGQALINELNALF